MEGLVGTGISPVYVKCRRQYHTSFSPKFTSRVIQRVCVRSSGGFTSRTKLMNLAVSASVQSAQASAMGHFDNTLPSKAVLEIWRSVDAVCFDVDSTVCLDEGIDELADFCGAGKAVAEWAVRAMSGSVPFEEALAARLSLFNPTLCQVQDFLKKNPPKYVSCI